MLPENFTESFEQFAETAHQNDILGPKTSLLVALASALVAGCEPCAEKFLDRARQAGVSDQEIGAAAAIAMCVNAGSVRAIARRVNQEFE